MFKQCHGLFFTKAALHGLEYTVIDVLDRHIVIGLEDIGVSNIINEFKSGCTRIEVEDTCTFYPIDVFYGFNKVSKPILHAHVTSVAGRVLRDEREVIEPLFGKIRDFFDNGFKTSGVQFPFKTWDGTEAALLVTSLSDLDVGVVA